MTAILPPRNSRTLTIALSRAYASGNGVRSFQERCKRRKHGAALEAVSRPGNSNRLYRLLQRNSRL